MLDKYSYEEEINKTVTLVVTHQCNLQCSYCYEKHKDNYEMLFETAKEIVDKELEIEDGLDSIEFDFMGGEPLLQFDLIKQIIEYTVQKETKKQYIFYASTNGTLLKEEWKPWLLQHRCVFQMGLSLDGTREMHNINRCNSYDQIDLPFFLEAYPLQPIKMTISKETLKQLAEGVISLTEKECEFTCNLAYGIDWSSEENVSELEKQLNKLIEYYLSHPDVVPCSMLDPIRVVNIESEEFNGRVCGAGWMMKAYDYNGESYPCQFFLPISVGTEKARKSGEIEFPEDKIPRTDEYSECNSCILKSVCFTCFGANYAASGDIYTTDKSLCRLFKIQFKAMAYLISKWFEMGVLEERYGEYARTLVKAAVKINAIIEY